MHLNVYLAKTGICSRRKATDLIKQKAVTVNHTLIDNPAYQVQASDKVSVNGKQVKRLKKNVYILLHKPIGYITTTSDELMRKTVLDLVPPAIKHRLFPVGRLDKDSSGALLITNDGSIAYKLTHPRFQVKKVYEVTLSSPLSSADMLKLKQGVHLSDCFIKPDHIAYMDKHKTRLTITIHSGKNRVIRRMIEKFTYKVKHLVRKNFGPLSISSMPSGAWRYLNAYEINRLKIFANIYGIFFSFYAFG